MLSTNVAAALILSLVLAWLCSLLNWVLLKPKRLERFLKKQGIRGNPYRIFHGDLKEMKSMRAEANFNPMETLSHDYLPRVRPFLHRSIQQYGKIFLTWDGPIPVVNIAETRLVREVFTKYNEFQKTKSNPILDQTFVRGIIAYEGQKWAHHRKLLNHAFHMENLKSMLPAFYTSCNDMLSLWEEKVSKSENEIEVSDDLTTLSANIISRVAFGSSYEEGKRIFQLNSEQLIITHKIMQSVYFPGLRFIPTKNNKKISRNDREIKNLVRGVIQKRKEGGELGDDLLGVLMEENLKDRITTNDMIDECKLLYLAGQDTTANMLMWTMILLSKHRDWQSKAREEVVNTFGHTKPDFDDLNHLKTMNMIIQEVMRLYPPVVELRRTIVKDNTKLGNLTLSRGTLINLPIIYIHQDPEIWGDDAKEFNPERFAKGVTKASKGNVSFLAFGWGPRICLGLNFVMLEAKMLLSMILQRFEFEISPSYVHAPSAYGLLYPQFAAPLIFHRL